MVYVSVCEERDKLVLTRARSTRTYVILAAFLLAAAFFALSPFFTGAFPILLAISLVYVGIEFTEEAEECTITKHKISRCARGLFSRWLTKRDHVLVYSEKVIRVFVHGEPLRYCTRGHAVFMELESGREVPVTSCCTLDDPEEHRAVANKIAVFLDLPQVPRPEPKVFPPGFHGWLERFLETSFRTPKES
eukprot:m.191410 g.191410  ORF g.191410 m.191410 type:complete len:191 (-) comp25709_c0_seq6:97-669(-)